MKPNITLSAEEVESIERALSIGRQYTVFAKRYADFRKDEGDSDYILLRIDDIDYATEILERAAEIEEENRA